MFTTERGTQLFDLPTTSDPIRTVRADSLTILPALLAAGAAVVSDPPYGMNWNTNSKRFSGGVKPNGRKKSLARGRVDGRDWPLIGGDREPFDPAPWLAFPKVLLWGYNHFAQRLPVGTVLVWLKKADALFGTFLSDAELGWMKGGHGVYAFRKNFPPPSRAAENGGIAAHPCQKPIALMRWAIEKLRLPKGSLIVDPYAGSGTTGIAALELGIRCLLIEQGEAEHAVAAARVERARAAKTAAILEYEW